MSPGVRNQRDERPMVEVMGLNDLRAVSGVQSRWGIMRDTRRMTRLSPAGKKDKAGTEPALFQARRGCMVAKQRPDAARHRMARKGIGMRSGTAPPTRQVQEGDMRRTGGGLL